jgi:vitamin B12 transporter
MSIYLSRPTGVCLLLASAWGVSAHAQSQAPSMGDVFVTGNRWGQRIEHVTADTEVILRADIEKSGAASLTELLGRVAGIQATSYGQSGVYVRGAEARMTALYIDGVRVESHDGMRLGGGAPWEVVPLGAIEKIEVIKGARSSVYGSDAMGGVVQIFTRPLDKDQTKVSVSAGQFDTQQTALSLSRKINDAAELSIQAGQRRTGGFDTRPDLVHTPARESQQQQYANATLGLRVSDRQRVDAQLISSDRRERMVPYSGGIDISQQSELASGSIKWRMVWDEQNTTSVHWGQSQQRTTSDAPNLYDLANDYRTTVSSLGAQHRIQMGSAALLVHAELKEDRFTAAPNAYNAPIAAKREQQALGAGYELQMGQNRIELSGRYDDYSQFGGKFNYSVAYLHQLDKGLNLVVSQTTGFRAPTLEQTFGQYGNASLKPEESLGREIALDYRQAQQTWRASLYETHYENLISSAMSSTNCALGMFCYYNVDVARVTGASFKWSRSLGTVRVAAAYDYLQPKNQVTGKQLSLRAKDQAQISLSTLLWGVDSRIEWQGVGKKYDNAANTVELPAYSVMNLMLQKSLTSQWSTWLRLNNLTDRRYVQVGCTPGVCTYAAPGRAIYVGVEWRSKN